MRLKTVIKLGTIQMLVIALAVGANIANAKGKSGTIPQPPCCDANATQPSAVEQSMRNKSGKLDPPQPESVAQPSAVEQSMRNKSGVLKPTPPDDRIAQPSAPTDPVVERRAHSGPGGTPPVSAVARNKTVWWIPSAVGLAAVGGVLAATTSGSAKSK